MRVKAQAVKGHVIRKPRLTLRGYWVIASRFVLPFLALLLVLDVVLYLVMRYGFDACYGVMCLL